MEGGLAPINALSFSPCGTKIVTGSENLVIWDTQTGSMIGESLKNFSDRITSVNFSADGMRIVTGSKDKIGIIWDAKSAT